MAPGCSALFFLLATCSLFSSPADAGGFVGVNYGRVANNLPSPAKVVELLKANAVTEVKLYDAEPTVLSALSGSGIGVVVALPNELLVSTASRAGFALAWVKKNVAAWHPATQIRAVAVGNEVFASAVAKTLTPALVPAMQNVHKALQQLGLDADVKVSSPLALTALQSSYPSSTGAFRADLAGSVMRPMLELLHSSGSYLMVNAYPFFAYAANSDVISLDYALFRPNAGVVDAGNGLRYYSLLDAQLDAVFAATKALGYGDIRLVVSETGWPSKGDSDEKGAGPDNAAAYNGNLARRVLSGNARTPARPDADVDVYLFALFNENQKPGPTSERNYGLFYPNEEKVYDVEFQLQGGATKRDQETGSAHTSARSPRAVVPPAGSGSSSGNGGQVSASSTGGATWCVGTRRWGRRGCRRRWTMRAGRAGRTARPSRPGRRATTRTRWRRTRRSPSTATTRRSAGWSAPVTSRAPPMSSPNPLALGSASSPPGTDPDNGNGGLEEDGLPPAP